jgi:hypothetical protein
VIVPYELPRVELVQQLQVWVGTVGRVALAIFPESEDFFVRLGDAVATVCVSAGRGDPGVHVSSTIGSQSMSSGFVARSPCRTAIWRC